jgi:dsRNA-specific ribonuclease
MNSDTKALLLRQAWLGDAVLTLWARRMILAETGAIDGPRSVRMTSNQFLGSIGNPDEVEAVIGRIYESHGLDEAFQWIEANLLPMFERQERNRRNS